MDIPLGEPILRNHRQSQTSHPRRWSRIATRYGYGYISRVRSISAGKFKDTCLRILDEVAVNRVPVTITKWGRPVARLLPVIGRAPVHERTAPDATGVAETVQPYGSDATAEATENATQRLHRLAAELGVSPDDLLQEVLDAYAGGSALDDLIERAKSPVGAFRSGRPDLAEKHDEAFAEILEEEMARWRLPE